MMVIITHEPSKEAPANTPEIDCLTSIIFFEARGESRLGQKAAAAVAINRSKNRNKSICDVMYESKQFEFTKHTQQELNLMKRREIRTWNIIHKRAIQWYNEPVQMNFDHFLNEGTVMKRYGRLPRWYYAGHNHTKIGNHTFLSLNS